MRLLKYMAVLFAVLCITAGGKALAAEDGLQDFRDAYFPSMKDSRPFRLDLMFNGPTFQANTLLTGRAWPDGASVAQGSLSWGYTDMDTLTTKQVNIPLYAERSGGVISLYGNRDGAWQHDNVLAGITWFLDVLATDDRAIKNRYAETVKSVTSTKEGANLLRMDILIDGAKLAAIDVSSDRLQALPPQEKAEAEYFIRYFNAAAAANDLKVIWTVNKDTGETVTVAMDLTEIMRGYAKAVLEDSYQGIITLTPEETAFLASIGYYCNLHAYLSSTKDSSAIPTAIPADVKRGAAEHEFLKDATQEIISIVNRK